MKTSFMIAIAGLVSLAASNAGAFKSLVRLHTAAGRHHELIELYDRGGNVNPYLSPKMRDLVAEHGGKVSDADKSAIETGVAELRSVLAGEDVGDMTAMVLEDAETELEQLEGQVAGTIGDTEFRFGESEYLVSSCGRLFEPARAGETWVLYLERTGDSWTPKLFLPAGLVADARVPGELHLLPKPALVHGLKPVALTPPR